MRRRARIAAAAVVLVTACAPATYKRGVGVPAVGQIEIRGLPLPAAHGEDESPLPTTPPDTDSPTALAVEYIRDGLSAQRLDIVDIGSDRLDDSPRRVTIRVAATFVAATGTVHTSFYDVELRRDSDAWVVATARAVG